MDVLTTVILTNNLDFASMVSQVPENNPADYVPLHRRQNTTESTEPRTFFNPLDELPSPPPTSPGISILSPTGYGASWGNIGVGMGFQERARFTNKADAVSGFSFGFGNSQDNIGFQVGIGLSDTSDIFSTGTISVQLHRQVGSDLSFAVGSTGLETWGGGDGGSSGYGVVTKRFALGEVTQPWSELYVSLGVGGGQFRSESDIEEGVDSLGVFGGVAIRVLPSVSAIAEWSGQDLTLGASYAPFATQPLVIVSGITDLTGNAGDGARFIFGIGYGFSFD